MSLVNRVLEQVRREQRPARRLWWQAADVTERAFKLAKAAGKRCKRQGATVWIPEWAHRIAVLAPHVRSANGRRLMLAAARACAANPEAVHALDACARLRSSGRVTLEDLATVAVVPRAPKRTPEQRRAALMVERANHAREKLAQAHRKLATAERLVAKWDKRVRYYEGKGM